MFVKGLKWCCKNLLEPAHGFNVLILAILGCRPNWTVTEGQESCGLQIRGRINC